MSALRTNITLPQALVNRLHMSVPQGQRSKFITQAVAEKLGREKTKEDAFKLSLQANAALYKREAETWNITETESWPE
jgi:metal-responsive CopG/Arc/MetJ family transcriptional regulator